MNKSLTNPLEEVQSLKQDWDKAEESLKGWVEEVKDRNLNQRNKFITIIGDIKLAMQNHISTLIELNRHTICTPDERLSFLEAIHKIEQAIEKLP